MHPSSESVSYAVALDRMILGSRARLEGEDHISAALSAIFATQVTPDAVRARVDTIRGRSDHLADLLTRPGIEQRTDAWYAARHDLVTASDIDAAVKNGPSREFLKKKCGGLAAAAPSAGSGGPAPLKHGVMFEAVANAIYCARQGGGCVVHEFGLLLHPTVSHLGASPDGINELGVMVEIKCPYSRKIDGLVPSAYYAQIQGQLEVCGLDECDYVECEISNKPQDDDGLAFYAAAARGSYADYGVVLERCGPAPYFQYSPLASAQTPAGTRSADVMRAWEVRNAADCVGLVAVHRWRLDRINVVRVLRDADYVKGMLVGLQAAWTQVLRYRAEPAAFKREVLDAGATAAARTRPVYGFVDDDDTNAR